MKLFFNSLSGEPVQDILLSCTDPSAWVSLYEFSACSPVMGHAFPQDIFSSLPEPLPSLNSRSKWARSPKKLLHSMWAGDAGFDWPRLQRHIIGQPLFGKSSPHSKLRGGVSNFLISWADQRHHNDHQNHWGTKSILLIPLWYLIENFLTPILRGIKIILAKTMWTWTNAPLKIMQTISTRV